MLPKKLAEMIVAAVASRKLQCRSVLSESLKHKAVAVFTITIRQNKEKTLITLQLSILRIDASTPEGMLIVEPFQWKQEHDNVCSKQLRRQASVQVHY